MALGDFQSIYNVQTAASRMWANGLHKRELDKNIVAAQAVLSEQAVSFVPVMKDNVCIGNEAIWLKSCDTTVTDCDVGGGDLANCDVSGVQAEGTKKTYTPNVCLTYAIQVRADDCAGFNSFEEKLAFQKLHAKAVLENEFNKKVIAALSSNAQVNAFPEGGTVVGTKVTYPSAEWVDGEGAKLLPKFHISAQKAYLTDAFMINGSNLYEYHWLYQYKEKSGSAERFNDALDRGPFKQYWDIIDLDTTIGASATFVVDRSSLAFCGANHYMNLVPEQIVADKYAYREPSMRLAFKDGAAMNPVYFDVVEQHSCAIHPASPVKNRRWKVVNIEFTLRGSLITGPEDCGGKSGILHYEQV